MPGDGSEADSSSTRPPQTAQLRLPPLSRWLLPLGVPPRGWPLLSGWLLLTGRVRPRLPPTLLGRLPPLSSPLPGPRCERAGRLLS